MSAEDHFPSYRAPQENKQVLCLPPWESLTELASGGLDCGDLEIEILGTPLEQVVRDARREVVELALVHTRAYDNAAAAGLADGPLILTGHQPSLVHPGVWLKNFAAAQLADQVGGTAISLIIDNDLCRAPSIRVPTGTIDQPQVVDVAFDRSLDDGPFEERGVADQSLWESFGQRVAETIAPLVPDPLITDWWPEVVRQSEQTSNIGLAIAQARHVLERSWGCQTLELPQSQVCQTRAFARFALHLLVDAARFRGCYNGALAEYRRAHRLRNAAQPLPDLHTDGDWIESPFWIWSTEHPVRQALFVRRVPSGLQLSNQNGWTATLPDCLDDAAIDWWLALREQGIRIRTRALTTTLFARLLLAETFIHGIGGAKYDQVTDRISQQFFDVAPPQYIVVSGTLRLPIDHPTVAPSRQLEIRQLLRELRYHPEKHVTDLALSTADRQAVEGWIVQKYEWVQTAKTAANAADRHAKIEAANDGLQPWLAIKRQQLERELSTNLTQTRINHLLESREYPFCLFPREVLQDFLLDFSSAMP